VNLILNTVAQYIVIVNTAICCGLFMAIIYNLLCIKHLCCLDRFCVLEYGNEYGELAG